VLLDATHSLLGALALHEFFRGPMDLDLGIRYARSALAAGVGSQAKALVVVEEEEMAVVDS